MSINSFLKQQTNYKNVGSIAWKLRKKRMKFFNDYFEDLFIETESSKPINILDVGGVPEYWTIKGFRYLNDVTITTLNLEKMDVPEDLKEVITSVKGNAIDMSEFEENSFDFVFSNSVIEHVGDSNKQKMMAKEMLRVAKHGYLQTPCKYFIIEPHFLFPFFSVLPHCIRVKLVCIFQLGHFKKALTKEAGIELVNSITLLSVKELRLLFPKAVIRKEKWLGMTKSYILTW